MRSDGSPGLADVIDNVRATILVGLSTAAGAFSEPIVRAMASKVDRPIIFPLSNPTSRSEADPADLVRWSGGRVLTATGSPHPPVEVGGRRVEVAQSNNVFIFPAVGLGVIASGATRVTDAMMQAAATTLGEVSPALTDPQASLLPPVGRLREVALHIATAVALAAVADGAAPQAVESDLRRRVSAAQWSPHYES